MIYLKIMMFVCRLITYGITKRVEFNLFFYSLQLEIDKIYDKYHAIEVCCKGSVTLSI